ncbi:MAG TPA: hypothetical protein VMV93_03225 [Chloroflexota bacterium]|nr:hypothetical protein [Chloroflexota bacterium]
MRQIKLTTKGGDDAGAIVEQADGSLVGQGRAANILKLAPGKTIDYWVNQLPHSHYLDFQVEG